MIQINTLDKGIYYVGDPTKLLPSFLLPMLNCVSESTIEEPDEVSANDFTPLI